MDYNKLRKKTNKYYKEVPTFQMGGGLWTIDPITGKPKIDTSATQLQLSKPELTPNIGFNPQPITSVTQNNTSDQTSKQTSNDQPNEFFTQLSGVNMKSKSIGNGSGQMSANAAVGAGIASKAITGVANAVDNLAMGDKNFGAQSQAIDTAVHGASSALMSSGNPYAMIAGAALEGANFLTKAGGQTVQGFDVDINSSGYGNLGHMESSSSRDFGAMIGLGGIFTGNVNKKLAKRNEQAKMALAAANIANEQKFEQEARANTIDNVIQNNQIALAGGLETSLLGG